MLFSYSYGARTVLIIMIYFAEVCEERKRGWETGIAISFGVREKTRCMHATPTVAAPRDGLETVVRYS